MEADELALFGPVIPFMQAIDCLRAWQGCATEGATPPRAMCPEGWEENIALVESVRLVQHFKQYPLLGELSN